VVKEASRAVLDRGGEGRAGLAFHDEPVREDVVAGGQLRGPQAQSSGGERTRDPGLGLAVVEEDRCRGRLLNDLVLGGDVGDGQRPGYGSSAASPPVTVCHWPF